MIYDYDSNVIIAEPLKNHTAKQIVAAYKCVHTLLLTGGLRPALQCLDNEASTAYIHRGQHC